MRRLRIGASACFFHADPERPIFKGKTLLYLEQALSRWVMAEGALLYLIPEPSEGTEVRYEELAEPLDGLVLQGGSDVSPLSYGESPMKEAWNGDRIRDLYEMALIKAFRDQRKPILGICRGAQLMNVAFGGSLFQDIATQRPESGIHRDWKVYEACQHALKLEAGSRMASLYPEVRESRVNSIHHQGLKDLGKGLRIEARSGDGMIEAISAIEGPYAMALQWHPEFQDLKDESLLDGRLVLRDFLKHCEAKVGA